MNFEVTKAHIGGAIALGVLVGVLQHSCEKHEAHSHEDEAKAEEAVEASPTERRSLLAAREAVREAHFEGLQMAMRKVNRRLTNMKREGEREAPGADEADVLTFLVSANIHGEREDCGCKANPLGGLDRRQTLVELAATPGADEAREWWGSDLPDSDATFVVDAGDMLFRSVSAALQPEVKQKQAREHAEAVVAALNVNPPDLVNVGELELVFGLDTLRELADDAKFPFISANLRTASGERPFDGHRVIERDGHKVAFIGLTKQKPGLQNFWKERDLKIDAPAQAYRDELDRIPDDVDMVVLMSNLGANGTAELVRQLVADDVRVDAAIVSNTNRLTRTPNWVAGVPVIEPLNRGKYFGRFDVYLGDEPGVDFANALEDPFEVTQRYRRTWNAYHRAREERNKTARQIAKMRQKLEEQGERAAEADKEIAKAKGEEESQEARELVEKTGEKTRSRIDLLEKKLETLDKRVEMASEALARESGDLRDLEGLVSYGDGDDWAGLRIVQVKIDIPQDPDVRRVLDRYASQ